MAQVTLSSRQIGLLKEAIDASLKSHEELLGCSGFRETYPNLSRSCEEEMAELRAAKAALNQAEPSYESQ